MNERRKREEKETEDIAVIFQKVTGYKNKFRIGGQ